MNNCDTTHITTFAVGSGQVWACGSLRAEIYRMTSRKWHWRVWAVLGNDSMQGIVLGKRRAAKCAVAALSEAAGINE